MARDDPGYVKTPAGGPFGIDAQKRRPGIYTYLGGPPNSWSKEMVDFSLRQFKNTPDLTEVFDNHSIMMYHFDDWMLRDGKRDVCYTDENLILSDLDRRSQLQAYPRNPAQMISNITERRKTLQSVVASPDLPPSYKESARSLCYDLVPMIKEFSTHVAVCSRKMWVIGPVAMLTLLSGCAGLYTPKAVIPSGINTQFLADVSQPNLLEQYNALPQGDCSLLPTPCPAAQANLEAIAKIARRNRILQEFIILVDHNYAAFEGRYYGSDATVNFAGDLVSLGLTGVSSVTGTAHLKSVLSAVATGTTGIKTSYLKNFYDQQTRSAVVQQMRSSRAAELAVIQDANHMKAAVTAYSLESGLAESS